MAASRSVNKVLLIGRLGKDAETKYTPSGVAVTNFSVATTRSWKDQQSGEWKEETNWTNVTAWRKENLAPYLIKGKQVYVEGRLHTRSYDNKDGQKVYVTEVVADEVLLLGGNSNGSGEEGGYDQPRNNGGNGGTRPPQQRNGPPQRNAASGQRQGPQRQQQESDAFDNHMTAQYGGDDPQQWNGVTDDDVPFN